MAKLYRQHVLKEQAAPETPLMQIQGLKKKSADEENTPVVTH
jgi:hypothetical protein